MSGEHPRNIPTKFKKIRTLVAELHVLTNGPTDRPTDRPTDDAPIGPVDLKSASLRN